eukprot:2186029-Pyramimonas_sp.AAC.2
MEFSPQYSQMLLLCMIVVPEYATTTQSREDVRRGMCGLVTSEYSNNSHRKILDYGCGKGAVARYLVQHVGVNHVLGCDISETCLMEARDRTEGLREMKKCLAFELISRTGESVLPPNTYDGAMCNFVISMLPNKAEQVG